MQQVLPALEVPKLDCEYNSGASIYNFLSRLASTRPIIPHISPTIPKQNAPTIDMIPNTNAPVEFGRFVYEFWLGTGFNRSLCSIRIH